MKRTKIDIRCAIKEHGYTVRDFSEKKIGFTPANFSQTINGNPTVKKLGEICDVLGCDITDLFYPIADAEEKTATMNEKNETVSAINTHASTTSDNQPTIQATTFCPHCGARVEVGVVLLAR